MNNLIEFIENHFKIKMDSELNKLTEEEKEKLREKIIENNFVFGHSFLTQIKLNTFDIKELQKPLNADLKKEEVINFLKKNLYL
jgi:ribosomal protein S13